VRYCVYCVALFCSEAQGDGQERQAMTSDLDHVTLPYKYKLMHS